jgi:hypothetical protein
MNNEPFDCLLHRYRIEIYQVTQQSVNQLPIYQDFSTNSILQQQLKQNSKFMKEIVLHYSTFNLK